MKTTKHTAGPWHIGLQGGIYQSKSGAQICIYDMATNFDDENLANARLIAAAPELLAACEMALNCGDEYKAEQALRAAIAKAKGKLK